MMASDLFTQVRNVYVANFGMLASSSRASGLRVTTEQAFRRADGSLATTGEGDLPQRSDICVIRPDGVAELLAVASPGMVSHEPWKVVLDTGVELNIMGFVWEHCVVRATGLAERFDDLRNWFFEWFDPEDQHQPDAGGFYNRIHFLGLSGFDGPTATLEIDLGSAPVDALMDLLGCLEAMGARSIQLETPGW